MEEKQMEAAESFALISRMIENTRNKMERNAGRPFLIWGYTTVIFTLLVCGLIIYTQDPRWNYLWFGLPIVGGLGMYLTRRAKTEEHAYTFVDRVIGHVWLVLGLAAWFTATLSMLAIAQPPILFLIVLLMGIGTTTTGLIIRFTPASIGGFIGIILAPLMLVVANEWAPALFIVAFVAMMIIPGHILNYKSNRRV
ncbi:MAG: hypothetical protein RR410_00530 [Alistipes sp.]